MDHLPTTTTTELRIIGQLSLSVWLATEGGAKCPQCGRYARQSELGVLGGRYVSGATIGHLSMYGHLPGFGCNRGGQ